MKHPLATVNVFTKSYKNPSSSLKYSNLDQSDGADQLTDIAIA